MSNELINIAEYENKLNEWYDKFFVLGMLTKHIGLWKDLAYFCVTPNFLILPLNPTLKRHLHSTW